MRKIIEEDDLGVGTCIIGTDKSWPHSYIDGFYEMELLVYRCSTVRLLEIGFRHGASLALWSSYFVDGTVHGIDNGSDTSVSADHPISRKWIERSNVKTAFCDAYTHECVDRLDGEFDVLIDDGPHTLSSQIKFIKLYSKKIASGGIAIIEDLQRYGGLLIWPLVLCTPLKFEVELFDFRKSSGVPDDMLYVLRNSGRDRVKSRFRLLVRAIGYTLLDPLEIVGRKLRERWR